MINAITACIKVIDTSGEICWWLESDSKKKDYLLLHNLGMSISDD